MAGVSRASRASLHARWMVLSRPQAQLRPPVALTRFRPWASGCRRAEHPWTVAPALVTAWTSPAVHFEGSPEQPGPWHPTRRCGRLRLIRIAKKSVLCRGWRTITLSREPLGGWWSAYRPAPQVKPGVMLGSKRRLQGLAATFSGDLCSCLTPTSWPSPRSRGPTNCSLAACRDYLDRLASTELTMLPYDQRAAEWHGRERARLLALGLTPPFADSQLAAVAAVNKLTLVTHNTKDFDAFSGLRVVDWTTGAEP